MAGKRKKPVKLPDRVYFKNGAYRYLVPKHQRARLVKSWIKLGVSVQDMWHGYSKLMAELNCDGGMMALFDRYAREVIPDKAPRTQLDNAREMKNLIAVFGKMEPEQITQAMAYQYLDIRGKSSATQANHEMALLRHVFTKAVRWGKMLTNPLTGMHKLPVAIRTRTPSADEFRAVRKHADPMLAHWMDLKWQFGLRQGDMLALRVDDLKQDGIHVTPNKNHKTGVISWSQDLRETVAAVMQQNRVQGMTLFCNSRGQPLGQRALQARFRKAVKAAMLAGDLVESFTENDIRSSFGTESEEQGHDATNQLLHKSATAKKHYVHRKITTVTPLNRV